MRTHSTATVGPGSSSEPMALSTPIASPETAAIHQLSVTVPSRVAATTRALDAARSCQAGRAESGTRTRPSPSPMRSATPRVRSTPWPPASSPARTAARTAARRPSRWAGASPRLAAAATATSTTDGAHSRSAASSCE
ncbi:hypothetical protein BC477_07030 [Clavibacter michiganensis subsp. michiganensis]|uniref:Uncharacterized protein n=1 Tax=Clavibacter michiganensis subsp. michiganensis TaxID=33013 RepID=A0A251XM46_CLAMM|nr:hypothetical protein BC477_07030 [Clavibacter michiganensis subsp. michiganensis]OUE04470.1 hypothetical protein CMMCAS07_05960 [Clavibacter michiganensis subsp. michiganensis]